MGDVRTDLARRQMIDAFERLVAQRGLAAVSLRDVQVEAGQRNKSAATYHFGSRRGLIEAVLASRMAAVSERRRELLAAIDAAGSVATTHSLVDALVRPIAEHTGANSGSHWARFLFQCSADPEVAAVVTRSVEGESYREAQRRLLDALVELPGSLRRRRVDHAVLMAFTSLASVEARRDSGRRQRLPIAAEIDDLVDICAAIVSTPASDRTLASASGPAARSR